MEDLYPLFLEKIYILNPSQAFQTLYKWTEKSFLKKSHMEKIFVLRDINLKNFHELIPLHQLPVTYGGELSELEQYWYIFKKENYLFISRRTPTNTLEKFEMEEKKEIIPIKEENMKTSEELIDFKEALIKANFQKKCKIQINTNF